MSLQNNNENVRNLILYFQVHQPKRFKPVKFFDIGADGTLYDDFVNQSVVERVASSCYLPTNALLLKLIKKHPEIKVCFSISGVALDQFAEYTPEVIDSFKALADTGNVEFLGETYFHSLASLMNGHEFEIQVLKHAELIENLFGRRPTFFRNTELIYNNEIGKRAALLGFEGVITDGVQQILKNNRNAHQVYEHPEHSELKILLRDYILSDDIAFRFFEHGVRLTPEKYMKWINDISPDDKIVTIGMDYETFGEHQKKESGIHDFLKKLLKNIATSDCHRLMTPTEAVRNIQASGKLNAEKTVSWADHERDLSAWLGNDMQKDAFDSLGKIEREVKALNDSEITRQWRLLQTSDHFYYMSTKQGSDGSVHNYFSHYPSPYEAFINYMNVLTDFTCKIEKHRKLAKQKKAKKITKALRELAHA
ncbi:MAG TPA: glycoside hydrolase family 57 protein [Chryseosolibacter sp.]|nr:glycoside hydrolase family 57 protein [Chryseosolibacter sp.]